MAGNRHTLLCLGLVALAATACGSERDAANAGPVDPPDAVPQVERAADVAASELKSWNRSPALPRRSLALIEPGGVVEFYSPGLQGLSTVGVESQVLERSDVDEPIGLQLTPAEPGRVDYVVEQTFDGNDVARIPVSSYVGELVPAPTGPGVLNRVSQAVFEWGDLENQVGLAAPNESEWEAPTALAGYRGAVVLVDVVNRRVATLSLENLDLSTLQPLPTSSYLALATNGDQGEALAIDPINGEGVELSSGNTVALPSAVGALPVWVSYALGGNGRLYTRSPFDSAQYEIGPLGGSEGATRLQVDASIGRARVDGDSAVGIQLSLDAEPVGVDLGGTSVGILDTAPLADGALAVLATVIQGDSYFTELLVAGEDGVVRSQIDFDARISQSSHLANVDNMIAVGYANPDDGYHIDFYSVDAP